MADDNVDSLINNLIGENVSSGSNSTNSTNTNENTNRQETYQLPVQVGMNNKSLDSGDKPWIVGNFSPNKATDKNHPDGHKGIDLKSSKGTPVYAMASGIVKDVGVYPKSGNYVMLSHEGGNVTSFYAHLDSTNVQKGSEVNKSTIIGKVGDSGNAKFRGFHLHLEVHANGILIDPLSIVGKVVGSLSKKAQFITCLEKQAETYYKLCAKLF